MSDFKLEDIYPLSPMQQGMLFHTLYEPERGAYIEQTGYMLNGLLDEAAFMQAWSTVIARHPILRTAFLWEGVGEPVQLVYEQVDLPIEHLDWTNTPPAERDQRLQSFLAEDRARGFELEIAPLIRLTLVRWAPGETVLVWTHHHLLLDGWSLPLLLSELFQLYEAYAAGQTVDLPPVRPFSDYIAWLQEQDQAAAEQFWRKYLADLSGPTRLLVARPAVGTADGGDEYREDRIILPDQLFAQLQAIAQQNRVTLNTLLQGAWALLLSRYSGEQDIVFGATVSGRPSDLHGAETMIGLFINTLPIRLQVESETMLTDWLHTIHAHQAELRQYEYSSLAQIQAWSQLPPGTTLFENIFVVENYPVDASVRNRQSTLSMREIASYSRTNYPLTISVLPGPPAAIELGYDSRSFTPATAQRMLEHMRTLLDNIAGRPDQPLAAIPMINAGEQHFLIHAASPPIADLELPAHASVHGLFAAQVARSPQAPALIAGETSLSYAELDTRANRLAWHLRQSGVTAEQVVAICVERSPEMVVGLLAILKAGGAYLPLDPTGPVERLNTILADAEPLLILSQEHLRQRFADQQRPLLCLDSDWPTIEQSPTVAPPDSIQPDQLAYVIYTSGSTGIPKGVLVEHRSVVNHNLAVIELFGLAAGERMLQFASLTFDAAVEEIFPTLLAGATLVLRPAGPIPTAGALLDLVERHAVTVLDLPTAYWHSLVSDLARPGRLLPESLRLVVVGGEEASSDRLALWQQISGDRVRWLNTYGPTEATVITTAYELQHAAAAPVAGRVPIGRPLPNTRVYLLDEHLTPVPAGTPGEICISGIQVARGYLNRPAETADRFVADPFVAMNRMYRSGDLGRLLPDGNIEFLGRRDQQIKLRGYRVELGEVEALLSQSELVAACTITAGPDQAGTLRLVAYVVPETPAGNAQQLEDQLRDHMQFVAPEYMRPALYIALSGLPLTATGKIDRRALPEPNMATTSPPAEPRSPAEELIAGIWQDLLSRNGVGIHDDFFALGGHSLLATRLVSRLRDVFQVELELQALFLAPTVAGVAAMISERQGTAALTRLLPPITPVVRDTAPPLSFAQQRLWFLDQLEPDSPLYNNPGAVRLQGKLNHAALEHSLNGIVARHEVLRTGFVIRDGQPVQQIIADLPVELALIDLRHRQAADREAEARHLATEEVRRPFALTSPPLLRASLLQLADDDYLLLFVMHHIVSDGWSMGVFIGELVELYRAFVAGDTPDLPPLPIQYADFAHWQRSWLTGNTKDSPLTMQLDYWRTTLQGSPPVLMLPTDRPRPPAQSFAGASFEFEVPTELVAAARAFSAREGATLFMTLLAAFKALLFRYSSQEDILVGTPIANRTRTELEGLIGFFVNTLVIRSRLQPELDFFQLVAQVREATLGAYAHQDLPFEMLVEALQPQRDLSHAPLFQVMFVLDNTPQQSIELPDLQLSPFEAESGTARFDMTWQLTETADGLFFAVEYATDLFAAATIARMAGHYLQLLAAALHAPELPLGELPLLSTAERELLLVERNRTTVHFPATHCIHWLFEQHVDAQPAASALVFGPTELSYAELDRRANQLAHHLRRHGIDRGSLVGICTARSIEMIVAILGVLKASAAYVPLDPSYPTDRLAFMLADAGVDLLLTQAHLRDRLPLAAGDGPPLLALDADWPAIATEPATRPAANAGPADLAYVIYTSGSTGRPKGTLLHHRGLCNLVTAQRQTFDVGPGSRVLQFSALSFDASVWELVMALGNGGTLVLAEQEQLASSFELLRLLRDAAISIVTLPPSLLALLDPAELPALQTVVAAGERCSREIVQRWAPGRQFFNAYGPTETTVCATIARCTAKDPADPAIGRPLPNFQLFVLDPAGAPVPVGVPGELYIGGVGIAHGYLGRPELTAERFVVNPFQAELPAELAISERLYRSGDLVRYRADGNLEFLGRIDHQVKLRGFRIELAEIEAVLRRHNALQDALVLAREATPGNPQLVAYVIAPPDTVTPAELRAFLHESLPEYMLPAAFVRLDAWPLTPSRKIDRAALPAADPLAQANQPTYVAPRDETEAILATICAELLGIGQVGVHDDFFTLGGHSLLATRFLSRIHEHFQIELPLRSIFEQPTVAGVAALLKEPPAVEPVQAPAIVARSRAERRMRRADLETEQQ